MCGRMRDMKQSGPEHVKCDDPKLMAGRYITIAAGFNHLGICEVQVSCSAGLKTFHLVFFGKICPT